MIHFVGLPNIINGAMGNNLSASAGATGDIVSIPESEMFPGVGNGNPFQYFCWENPMDQGAWRTTVHGVAKSQTPLNMHTPR